MYAVELDFSDDTGALLVFLVDTRDELDTIVAADEYYTAPGTTVTVHEWNPVIRSSALDGL